MGLSQRLYFYAFLLTTTAVLSTACRPATVSPLPTAVSLAPTLTPTATPTPLLATATAVPSATLTPTATPCQQTGHIEPHVLTSSLAGSLNYRLYLPPCYGQDGRSYPVLTLLPGNSHSDAIWPSLGIAEAADERIGSGQIPPLLIVIPDGGWIANNSSGGPGSYETVIVQELRPLIAATTCAWADPAGQALGGLSRGGYWALEIAFQQPAAYASVGGHSAALLDSFAGPAINPQHTALTAPLDNLRIYLDIGQQDYVIHNVRQLHEDMVANNIAHTWVLNEGFHEEAYWQTHVADYLLWYTAVWPHDRNAYPACAGK